MKVNLLSNTLREGKQNVSTKYYSWILWTNITKIKLGRKLQIMLLLHPLITPCIDFIDDDKFLS